MTTAGWCTHVASAAALSLLMRPALSEVPRNAARRPPLSPAIQFVLRHAVQMLSRSECQLVYEDFSDSRGRTLAQNLAERGQSGADHFQEIVFEGADGTSLCLLKGVLAFTSAGSQLVYLCTKKFKRVSDGSSDDSAALIHEQLHTLGLLENPPTPWQITERVLKRCGH